MNFPLAHSRRSREHRPRCDVHAWLLPLPAWRPHWQQLAPLVDAAHARRWERIRDAGRRRDRLLAAALHRQVLATALALPPGLLPLYRSDSGQPRLALPHVHTSLAHCGEVVAVALSLGGEVGIDVEMRAQPSLDPIADLVCTPAEAAALPAPGAARDARLLELWVRKEAVLKALGVGLARAMHSFAAPGDGRHLALPDAGGARVALQTSLCAIPGDVVAAVAAAPGAQVGWRWHFPSS